MQIRIEKGYPVSAGDFDLMDRLRKRRSICAGAFGLGLGTAISTYGVSLLMSAVAAYYYWQADRGLKELFETIRARGGKPIDA